MQRRELLLASMAGSLNAAIRKDKLEQATALIERAVAEKKVRAAALHVRQDEHVFERGFGEARSPDTIFLIASITKPMTAAGLMILADRGKLALDDPAHRYLPKFKEGDRKNITIRHLLTHTSGLPDQVPENVELRKRHAPLKDFVAASVRTPLLFKPGTQVKYQSMGILLAAQIAERISGEPFPKFLERELFAPLGMKRTALGLGRFSIPDTALCQVDAAPGLYGGGSGDTKSWDWNSPYWRNLAAPWGGAHSTGQDIATFLGAFLAPDGRVLRKETAARMVVNQNEGLNEPWGIGFAVKPGSFGRACSSKTFGHSGATGTLAWADPAKRLSCVILTTLPADLSQKTLLKPVSDFVSESV
jgi:CubicO group peptidase (beta-lactamase class C family)